MTGCGNLLCLILVCCIVLTGCHAVLSPGCGLRAFAGAVFCSCARTSTHGLPSTGVMRSSQAGQATGERHTNSSGALVVALYRVQRQPGYVLVGRCPCQVGVQQMVLLKITSSCCVAAGVCCVVQQHLLSPECTCRPLQQLWCHSTHPQEAPGAPHKGNSHVTAACMQAAACTQTCTQLCDV